MDESEVPELYQMCARRLKKAEDLCDPSALSRLRFG
jgi:hypothetical protein